MSYSWQFNVILRNLDVFIKGAIITIGLAVSVCVISTLLGLGIVMLRKTKTFKHYMQALVNIVRAVPPLIWLIWFYYCIPMITKIKLDSFTTALIALSVGGMPYLAEIIRAGIDSVSKGQYESAYVIGFNKLETYFRIIIPQAVRLIIPPLMNEYITILKLTSLASIIAVSELVSSANTIISNTYRPLEVYTALAIMYVIMVLPLSYFAKKLERKTGGLNHGNYT